jgi:hypothetical protein
MAPGSPARHDHNLFKAHKAKGIADISGTPVRKLIEGLRRVKIKYTGNDQDAAKILNEAICAIEQTHQHERPFALQLALLLDASIEALEKAAETERRREAGKSMRCIADQERLKAVRESVAKAEKLFGSIS